MKNLKRILGVSFAICLVMLSAVLLTSCGGYVKPWGKTLSYAGMSDLSKTEYTLNNEKITLDKLLVKYFDDIDWKSTLGKQPGSVKDGANALSLINGKASDQLKTSTLKSLTFAFSDKGTVTINKTKYAVATKAETKPAVYLITIPSGDDSENEVISLKHYTNDTFYYTSSFDSSSEKSSKLSKATYTIEIKFNKAITTTGNNTTVRIIATAYTLFRAQ